MTPDEIEELLPYLTAEERRQLDYLLSEKANIWSPLPGPQTMAYFSQADIVGFGGAAGGGKSDLVAGRVLTHHKRALVVRREKAQTEGIVQRITEITGDTAGFNSQKGIWRLSEDALCEFAGLDNLGDERRWQGRPHDLKAFDEVTEMREHQVRFMMGWNRTNDPDIHPQVVMTFNPPTTVEGRWVIDFFGPWLDPKHPMYPAPPGELRYAAMLPTENGTARDVWLEKGDPFVLIDGAPCYDFNPADYRPEDVIVPKSRTFVPSRVTDNPYYMASGYMSTLQALPEPLRSQMLYGDFQAGVEDDEWQVIPTAWVEAAMARWKKPDVLPPMDSMGVDVARGGADNTIIARRHGWWFDEPKVYPGTKTPDGPTAAGLIITCHRDKAPIHIDVIGVGAAVYDFTRLHNKQTYGINVSEKATTTDTSGRLQFANLRSQLVWRFRELLDPQNNYGLALPPSKELLADLCAYTWKPKGPIIQVVSREELVAKIGRSPDYASAYVLAAIETPKIEQVLGMSTRKTAEYDPYSQMG